MRSARWHESPAGCARWASAACRASALSAGATESSRSMMQTSAPEAAAFPNRSGRVAGVNNQLRTRVIVLGFMSCTPELLLVRLVKLVGLEGVKPDLGDRSFAGHQRWLSSADRSWLLARNQ